MAERAVVTMYLIVYLRSRAGHLKMHKTVKILEWIVMYTKEHKSLSFIKWYNKLKAAVRRGVVVINESKLFRQSGRYLRLIPANSANSYSKGRERNGYDTLLSSR